MNADKVLDTVKLADGEVFYDIFPSVEWVFPWFWLWVGLWVLFLVGVGWWLLKRKERARVVVVLTPYEVALQAIGASRALMGQAKPFASAVSDAVRSYLESVFKIPATERTTEEFFEKIAPKLDLAMEAKSRLAVFSEKCDRVKFSQAVFERKDLEFLYVEANTFVESTHAAEQKKQAESLEKRLLQNGSIARSDEQRPS
ncbi:MAG: hypothetical protein A2Y14_00465 [Verrucomicrobia bacterium GWF2_51_19]|nr:MAG: hypothetical protein A2Y14_00465 [Verrucomicrobia bacterium GWF2_51_19]HCJ12189.1 hypothetical protein [Opitutae bacterium]